MYAIGFMGATAASTIRGIYLAKPRQNRGKNEVRFGVPFEVLYKAIPPTRT